MNETNKILACISLAKRETLLKKYIEIGKENEYYEMLKILEEEYPEPDELETQLNIQIFLKGLTRKMKKEVFKYFQLQAITDVKNFYYAYGYIRNDDIEWDKEILDLAKENTHLSNYKIEVKNTFMLDSFLEKWFSQITGMSTKEKNNNKIKFKSEFSKHKKAYKQKLDILFDLLTSPKCKIALDQLEMIKLTREINKEEKEERELLESLEELPF